MREADAFQLSFLPHLVGAHFDALGLILSVRSGAEGELAKRAQGMLAALPARGPEIVSCVWQVLRILAANGSPVPAEPTNEQEAAAFVTSAHAAVAACVPRPAIFDHAARIGAALRVTDAAMRVWLLWSAKPDHPHLASLAPKLSAEIERLATTEPDSACPTTKMEAAVVTVALQRVHKALQNPSREAAFLELGHPRMMLAGAARALESAAWGTPRTALAKWRTKELTGGQLMRRIMEHHRWNIPVRVLPDGDAAPRTITQGTESAMFAFSDRPALDARPALLRSDRPDEQSVMTVVGAFFMRSLPEDVDFVVLDAIDDPSSGINYRREQRPMLRQVATEVGFELGACDWTGLNLDILRQHNFWVLLADDQLQTPIAKVGPGMPAVYSSEEALDAHLADASPAQREDYAKMQRRLLPGKVLFSVLAQHPVGVCLNPAGPGRSRCFNHKIVQAVAADPIASSTST